ncbi:MAG: RHS repeat-associated core domain-containing protein, partial [Clostridiales bacterium]|nr:RHS repeat-associated core domain-containing protein [Clostridiales bacterium]
LTKVGDKTISYDIQGNPISYLGHTLTWEKGRQLKSFDGIQYAYNANGVRTSKTVNGVKHTYTLDGIKILRETWGDNTLIPLYDNEDAVCGIIYNNEPFYFQKNLQGDIVGIINKEATTVAIYSYDAWGVPTVAGDTSECNIASVNPFRYRGYYYDEEIGMYYLQSRYYNPSVGRFINADKSDLINVTRNNLFSYCFNSPAAYVDYRGNIPQAIVVIAGICVALFVKTFALSIAMYAYAAIGARFSNNIDLSAWWNPIGNLMKNRLENSKLIKERINSYIGKISKKSYSKTEHINFADRKKYLKDMDLWLSVGNAANCKITVTKTGKRRWFTSKYQYKVKIELSDIYDFAKFNKEENGLIITAINNALGYYPMSWGILKSYSWKIKHEFNYYY